MSDPQCPVCAQVHPCSCKELKECLEGFIPRVLDYLRCKGFEEDISIDAGSLAWETALGWIADGKAARMTSERRRAYLCRTACNIARDLLRRHCRSPLGKAVSLSNLERHEERDSGVDPFEAAVRAEEAAMLKERLATLPPDDRCLLELYYFDDATFAQLADLLRCSPSAVWRRVHQAFDHLTDLMSGRPKPRISFKRRAS
jgi:RNA polymerase sigma factor (sigma-70 family)